MSPDYLLYYSLSGFLLYKTFIYNIVISLNNISCDYFPQFIFLVIFLKFAIDIQEILNVHVIKSLDLFFYTRS